MNYWASCHCGVTLTAQKWTTWTQACYSASVHYKSCMEWPAIKSDHLQWEVSDLYKMICGCDWYVWNLRRAVMAEKEALCMLAYEIQTIWYQLSCQDIQPNVHCMWLVWHVTFDTLDQCCIPRQLNTHSARQWPVLYTQTAAHSHCHTVPCSQHPLMSDQRPSTVRDRIPQQCHNPREDIGRLSATYYPASWCSLELSVTLFCSEYWEGGGHVGFRYWW